MGKSILSANDATKAALKSVLNIGDISAVFQEMPATKAVIGTTTVMKGAYYALNEIYPSFAKITSIIVGLGSNSVGTAHEVYLYAIDSTNVVRANYGIVSFTGSAGSDITVQLTNPIFLPPNHRILVVQGTNTALRYNTAASSGLGFTGSPSAITNKTLAIGASVSANLSQTFATNGISFGWAATYLLYSMKTRLYQKKIGFLGDSMIHGHTLGFSKTWCSKMAIRNNMVAVDYGVNGVDLAGTSNAYGASLATSYSAMASDLDIVAVFGGTNDQVNAIPIGTDSDATVDTFKGALNILCSGLQTKYPGKLIFFITPYNRNSTVLTYNAAIETICEKFSIPVFNNAKKGGVCWTNAAQLALLTMGDGYHLSEAGHDYASYKYESFINSL